MTRLALERVSFWYPATETPALDDVSMTVEAGEVVAVAGHVGAGASTLLLVAADLAPRVLGGRLAGRVERDARPALVLPTPWTQLSGMAFTVWDEVAFGPANLAMPRDEIARRVDGAIARLALTHLATRNPTTLSGGELQRVLIAGILAMDPALVLLDEPAAELDPEGAAALWRLVRTLADEGRSVVVATSDLDALPFIADRVLWLERGRVAGVGRSSLLASDPMCAAGLGTSVAGVWRDSGLAAPYPLTVEEAVRRWR